MFEAILFDLDGTLLDIDMDFFLARYFQEMGQMAALHGFEEPGILVGQILKSTDVMIKDKNPHICNEDVFMRHFFSCLPVDEARTKAFFEEFYRTGFPRLHKYCGAFSGVRQMMSGLFASGTKVVVATNPVFPRAAIQMRLDWAEVGHFPFDLITSYEVMHYCKPNPQYYQEIADRLGVEPSDCLMVGNDRDEDLAAGLVGMKTFLVEDRLIDRGLDEFTPDWRGRLPELYRFMEEIAEKRSA
ncbi:MAG: HAD family hydrolase [Syntrophomonadaceae bacterium]